MTPAQHYKLSDHGLCVSLPRPVDPSMDMRCPRWACQECGQLLSALTDDDAIPLEGGTSWDVCLRYIDSLNLSPRAFKKVFESLPLLCFGLLQADPERFWRMYPPVDVATFGMDLLRSVLLSIPPVRPTVDSDRSSLTEWTAEVDALLAEIREDRR
jgi:hypothetical protein